AFDLSGRRILITGAGAGIGAATARICASLGAEMILLDLAGADAVADAIREAGGTDRKSTRLNSSHGSISYAVFCLKKKKKLLYILYTKEIIMNTEPQCKKMNLDNRQGTSV